MKKTLLITGGAGFIGSHLIEDLLNTKKYNIIVLSLSFINNDRLKKFSKDIKVVYADKTDLEKIFKTNKIYAIIHLATRYIKNHQTPDEVGEMIDTNVRFPSILCDLASRYGTKYFINSGSFFEYKLGSKKRIKEGDQYSPYNFYSATKLAFSEILRYYCESFDMRAIDFKLFTPFGEDDNEKLMFLLINTLISGGELDFSGGEQKWAYTYVKDIVKAYVLGIGKIEKIKENYIPINVGYDSVVSIKQIAKILEQVSGKKFKINWGAKPYTDNEIFYANCDNTKLKRVLGWSPDYDIRSGLLRTYNYYAGKEPNGGSKK